MTTKPYTLTNLAQTLLVLNCFDVVKVETFLPLYIDKMIPDTLIKGCILIEMTV
jgi:hypothetical protein